MAPRPETDETADDSIQGEQLQPIGIVKRELTRPDGTRVVVEVPVYPPFRLPEGGSPRKPARGRSAPTLKRGRTPRGGGSPSA